MFAAWLDGILHLPPLDIRRLMFSMLRCEGLILSKKGFNIWAQIASVKEREIIKKTVNKLYPNLDNLDEIVLKAEQKENDSNHIQEFTKNVKSLSMENKIIIVETLWRIILSDGKSDIYEDNLMRRLAGLLYLDDKVVGETKVKVLNNK